MKLKRKKHCDKYLTFYRNNFKIRRPYQLLVDLTFCQEALQNRVQIKDQLTSYLDGEFKLFITDCIKAEGHLIGSKLHGALVIANNFNEWNCGHETPLQATKCIANLLRNSNHNGFFVATQDHELRDKLRLKAGIPLLHINHNVIVLEKPSTASIEASERQDSSRLIREHEWHILNKVENHMQEEQRRKRRGPKGPNPLSIKKKKNIVDSGKKSSLGSKKRTRRSRKRKDN